MMPLLAQVFNYMGPNPAHAEIIRKMWPEGGPSGYQNVQPIGPSPVVIHRSDLERIAKPWEKIAIALKTDSVADQTFGWVIEMWGYCELPLSPSPSSLSLTHPPTHPPPSLALSLHSSIHPSLYLPLQHCQPCHSPFAALAAAKIGLKHQELVDFQVEPGALSARSQLRDFSSRYWIFHYTYQFEYMLDGTPCKPWTIGEYSLDKRHFSDVYPIAPLPEPPANSNEAAFYLLHAFNEAMAAIPDWPTRQPSNAPPKQTLYGRRRLDWFSRHVNGFQTEVSTHPVFSPVHSI